MSQHDQNDSNDSWLAEISEELPKGSAFSFSCHAQHMQRNIFHQEHKSHTEHKVHTGHMSHMLHGDSEQALVYSCSRISTVKEAFVYADSGTCHENCVFRLAKGLWSLAQDGIIDESEYQSYVEQWHMTTSAEFGDGLIRDKTVSSSSDWFSMKIDKINTKMGDGPMAKRVEEARNADDPPEAEQFDCPISRWLLRLCVILQRESKDGTFLMTCRGPAGPMRVTHNIINMKLKTFCRLGLLRLVEKGGRVKGEKAKGSKYTCLVGIDGEGVAW